MKKFFLLIILFQILCSVNSIAKEDIIVSCEGQIRENSNSLSGKSSEIEPFYEELKVAVADDNGIIYVTSENRSHNFQRPMLYVPQEFKDYGDLKVSDNKNTFFLSGKNKIIKKYEPDDKYFSKITLDHVSSRLSLNSGKYLGKFMTTTFSKDGTVFSYSTYDFEADCYGINTLLASLNDTTITIDIDDNEIIPASSGTGFVISNSGLMVTNYHVIEGCFNVKALYDGKEFDTTVLASDKVNDLALIKAPLNFNNFFTISEKDGNLLEEVIVAGYPLGKKVSSSIKATSGTITALSGLGDNYGEFQTDAALNSGNSGGPIIDEMGNVVGVAVSKIQEEGVESFNFGIKSSVLRIFLNTNEIKLFPSSKKEMKKKDLGKLITDATIYLDCLMTGKQLKEILAQEKVSQKAMYSELLKWKNFFIDMIL